MHGTRLFCFFPLLLKKYSRVVATECIERNKEIKKHPPKTIVAFVWFCGGLSIASLNAWQMQVGLCWTTIEMNRRGFLSRCVCLCAFFVRQSTRVHKKLKRSTSDVSGEKYLWFLETCCMFQSQETKGKPNRRGKKHPPHLWMRKRMKNDKHASKELEKFSLTSLKQS